MSETSETSNEGGDGHEALEAARERLNEIWGEWGLALDTAASTMQMSALKATIDWLAKGHDEAWRAVRAVQYIMCDPETPGVHQRPAWAPLKKTLLGVWGNVTTQQRDVRLLQALLLAAWGAVPGTGGFGRVELLASAWEARLQSRKGGKTITMPSTVAEWSDTHALPVATALPSTRLVAKPAFDWAQFDSSTSTFQTQAAQGHEARVWGTLLHTALQQQKAAIQRAEGDSIKLSSTLGSTLDTLTERVNAFAHTAARGPALVNLLWWGQARYSRALRKPFRRLDKSDILFWTAWESSEIALEAAAEVEPAAAYLVEVLDQLHLDVDEKRPLRDWMDDLAASLRRAGDKAPPMSPALAKLAGEDALGLPVTWVRLRTHAHKGLENAAEDVALDLGALIDRGQWATWLFRESLLDRHFQGDPA